MFNLHVINDTALYCKAKDLENDTTLKDKIISYQGGPDAPAQTQDDMPLGVKVFSFSDSDGAKLFDDHGQLAIKINSDTGAVTYTDALPQPVQAKTQDFSAK
jgi:hypothetical protein